MNTSKRSTSTGTLLLTMGAVLLSGAARVEARQGVVSKRQLTRTVRRLNTVHDRHLGTFGRVKADSVARAFGQADARLGDAIRSLTRFGLDRRITRFDSYRVANGGFGARRPDGSLERHTVMSTGYFTDKVVVNSVSATLHRLADGRGRITREAVERYVATVGKREGAALQSVFELADGGVKTYSRLFEQLYPGQAERNEARWRPTAEDQRWVGEF